jgi:hypothetical protein
MPATTLPDHTNYTRPVRLKRGPDAASATCLRLGPWHGLQRHVKNVQMDAGHVFRHALNRFAR